MYDWSDYDDLVTQLDRRGMRAYFILDYSNPLMKTMYTPRTRRPACRKGASRRRRNMKTVSPHLHRGPRLPRNISRVRGIIWEIWNEPNIGFWKPKPNVDR